MSSEIENLRQLVSKLDEVQIELETIRSGLENNFENYKNISDISSDIADTNQGVLESINTLQIQATETVETAIKKATDLKEEMGKYYSSENTKIKKDFDTLLSDIQNELSTLKSTINKNISDAVNTADFDTSDITDKFNKAMTLLDKEHSKKFNLLKIKTEKTNKSIGNYHRKFDDVKIELDKTIQEIETKSKKINDATESINSANKSISMAMTLSMLFVGIVIGAGVMTYFKIDALSNFYFSQYEQKMKYEKALNIELLEMINKASELERWVIKNEVKIKTGEFKNPKQLYISVPKKYVKDAYMSKNNNGVIVLK